jgi:hypothetical protein
VVEQKIRDTEYATMPMNFRMTKEAMEYQRRAPLDRTDPRLEVELMEADNVMAAETRSTGCHYRHYDKFTGEWERRWIANPQRLPEHIHRDPEVRREGNDVPQAAFQSPYSHPAPYYENLIYIADTVSERCSTEGKKEQSEARYRGRSSAATTSQSSPPGKCSKQACSCSET